MLSYRGILFPFWWRINDHEKWTVFTPGRFDRSKPVPAFQRSSYADDLQHNVVSVFDPMLLRSKNLPLGWFIGVRNLDFASMLSDLVVMMSDELGFSSSDLLIYGSSGGGIPALRVATKMPECSLYLSNIQTDPRRYYPRFYRQMAKVAFGSLSDEHIERDYGNRLSSYDWDGQFTLNLAQNVHDKFHYENHFLPYVVAHTSGQWTRTANFLVYDDPESGHAVLPRSIELQIIGAVHRGESPRDLLPRGAVFDVETV